MQNNNSSFGNSSDFGIDNQFLNQQKSPLDLETFNPSSSSFDPSSTFEFGGNTYALGEYQIQEGDTLGFLAEETLGDSSVFGVISSINGIKNPNEIFAGQQILLPMSVYTLEEESNPQESVGVYTVGSGDTLAEIAEAIVGDASAYNEIAEYNGIDNPNFIFEGQEIIIPIETKGFSESDILIPSLKQNEKGLDVVDLAIQSQSNNLNTIGAKEVSFVASEENLDEVDNITSQAADIVGNIAKGLHSGLNGDFVIKDTRVGATLFEAKIGKPKLPIGFTQDQYAEFSEGLREGTKYYSQDVVMQGSRVTGYSYESKLPVKPEADLDIGVRVNDKRFGEVIKDGFTNQKTGKMPIPETQTYDTMKYALEVGKINADHSRYAENSPSLRTFRKEFVKTFDNIGTEVKKIDLSTVQVSNKFDIKPNIQAALPVKGFKTIAKGADILGKVATPIAVAADVLTISEAVHEDGGAIGNNTAKEATKIAADWAGSAAGGMTGAKIGAAIGTAFVPGAGTVVGGLAGGLIGGVAGGLGAQALVDSWF